MNKPVASLFVLAAVCLPAASQTFTNLDFESAVVQLNDPMFGFLDWNLAAPGWHHSGGMSTEWIYYGMEHIGLNQYFLLMDSNSPSYAPNTQLAGAYSLALASGVSNMPPDTTWVFAFISQSGNVPASARSIRLLARGGPFQLLLGGGEIELRGLGGNAFAGDISPFAGRLAELKIMNTSTNVHEPTVLDNIVFSPDPAPGRADLQIDLYAGLLITGTTGATYRVEYTSVQPYTNWTTLTNLLLTTSPYFYADPTPVASQPKRFYRAVALE
jgi:hypothetical protein